MPITLRPTPIGTAQVRLTRSCRNRYRLTRCAASFIASVVR